jgi:creatinine amidohydrolase/Fe(II)-dependent formamide hydrolase-like protein
MSTPEPAPLCIAEPETFWPWRRWPEFSRWPNRAETIVIVPLAGLADWGLGHALDVEETVLMHVLRVASGRRPASLPLLVIPPLRFVLGPDPGCAFTLDAPTAHAQVAEVLGSIASAGFKRVVLYNASPWNEEFIAAAARDNRIALRLQIFRISLSGLGLDLHPTRSATRRQVQTLVTALTGREPESPAPDAAAEPTPRAWGDERVYPLTGAPLDLAAARAAAPALLTTAADKLVSLLGEIHARPPLAHDGIIRPAQP